MCQGFEYHWGSLEPAAYYLTDEKVMDGNSKES